MGISIIERVDWVGLLGNGIGKDIEMGTLGAFVFYDVGFNSFLISTEFLMVHVQDGLTPCTLLLTLTMHYRVELPQ